MLCVVNTVKLKSSLLPPYGSNHIRTMVDSLGGGVCRGRTSHFPRKGNCVSRILLSKSSKASQSKKSYSEHQFVGAFPKQQFDKSASASLLSAKLISLLHYTVLKKKIHTFIKIVINESLRL